MELNTRIFELFADEADRSVIDEVHIGLGYTAVTLNDGRCGLCATLMDPAESCSVNRNPSDYEGRPAIQLLRHIRNGDLLTRVSAVALVNALNQPFARSLPEDRGDLMDQLALSAGSRIAMVGHFAPVAERLLEAGCTVKTFDTGRKIGSETEFYSWATKEADALILTATSVCNNTMENVLDRFASHRVPTVVMGPSTIMHPDIYGDLPVSLLAGTVVIDVRSILKAVRNGRGTLEIHHQAHKVVLPRNL